MLKLILSLSLILAMAYDADAVDCWNPTASPAATAATSPSSDTLCKYTHTYSTTSGAFTASNWPSLTAYVSASSCTSATDTTCSSAVTSPATVADLPKMATCYVSSTLAAASLTTQSTASCPAASTFCMATFSGTTAPVTVTQACATTCTASTTVACTQVASKNQVLGCYVGTYYTITGTSTFTKTICPLVSSGTSAGFCKNVYTFTTTNGITVEGSCVATGSCTAAAITNSGTLSMTGTTCSGTVYGNVYPSIASGNSIAFNMLVMILSSFMGLLAIHF